MELREWFATFLFVQVPGAEGRAGCWGEGGPGEAFIVVNGMFASSLFRLPIVQGNFELFLIHFVCSFTH